jgi:hypothetical protein
MALAISLGALAAVSFTTAVWALNRFFNATSTPAKAKWLAASCACILAGATSTALALTYPSAREAAMIADRVAALERRHFARHGTYTQSVGELVRLDHELARDLSGRSLRLQLGAGGRRITISVTAGNQTKTVTLTPPATAPQGH